MANPVSANKSNMVLLDEIETELNATEGLVNTVIGKLDQLKKDASGLESNVTANLNKIDELNKKLQAYYEICRF